MDMVLYYIKTLFGINMLSLFILVGLFLLIRDVPLLKKRNLARDSKIAKVLAYLYIFAGIGLFIVGKII